MKASSSDPFSSRIKVCEQRRGDTQALSHAERESAHTFIGHIAESDEFYYIDDSGTHGERQIRNRRPGPVPLRQTARLDHNGVPPTYSTGELRTGRKADRAREYRLHRYGQRQSTQQYLSHHAARPIYLSLA